MTRGGTPEVILQGSRQRCLAVLGSLTESGKHEKTWSLNRFPFLFSSPWFSVLLPNTVSTPPHYLLKFCTSQHRVSLHQEPHPLDRLFSRTSLKLWISAATFRIVMLGRGLLLLSSRQGGKKKRMLALCFWCFLDPQKRVLWWYLILSYSFKIGLQISRRKLDGT